MKKLIFVCSGNTCRSPLAGGIAKQIFPDKLLQTIQISSAGTSAVNGLGASELAIETARKNGIDITGHKTRLLTRSLILGADMIVAMTEQHRFAVGALEPSASAYTYIAGEFLNVDGGEIDDPIGCGRDAYERTFNRLKECILSLSERLENFDGWKQ